MLDICSLSVLMSCMRHCSCLFLCMVMSQGYVRRRSLGLGLYKWIASGLLGIRRMDKVPNTRIRELWGVMKGLKKLFSNDLSTWREWRMTELVRGSM